MNTFTLFSLEHLYIILGYTLFTGLLLILPIFFSRKANSKISAVIITIIKIAELLYRYFVLKTPGFELLPLHLCNFGLILAVITMFFKSYRAFEILYFWGIGAIFALLTPEVRVSFPSIWNFTFFSTHFYLFYATIFSIVYWGFKPTKYSLIKALLYLNLVSFLTFFINIQLDTNFMFINYKPAFSSPLDYFGPWPYYLISLEGITIFLFYILYFPFRKKKPTFSNTL